MTILADSVDIVIGVDPHKHTHTAAVVAADTGKHDASRNSTADPDGFTELLALADEHEGSRCWVIKAVAAGDEDSRPGCSPTAKTSARSTVHVGQRAGWARRPTTSTRSESPARRSDATTSPPHEPPEIETHWPLCWSCAALQSR